MNTLAPSDMSCPYTAMACAADAAVQQQFGFNPSNYTYREYFLPIDRDIGCRWGGLAMMGCGRYGHIPAPGSCRAWYRQSGAFTRAHELGHNLGLAHAGGEQGGSFVEYGDPQAIMGASFVMSSFIAGARSQLGTLPDSQLITWTPGMRHREIYSISHDLHTTGTARAALKFACPNCVPRVESRSGNIGGEIWVQYRGNEGYSSLALSQQDYQNRVYVHLMRRVNSRYGGSGSELWANLAQGQGYTIPNSGTSVYVCSINTQTDVADIGVAAGGIRNAQGAAAAQPPRRRTRPPHPRRRRARPRRRRRRHRCRRHPARRLLHRHAHVPRSTCCIPYVPGCCYQQGDVCNSPASRSAARSSCKSASSSRCRALWPASPPAASAPRCPEISVLARCTTSTARLRACAAWRIICLQEGHAHLLVDVHYSGGISASFQWLLHCNPTTTTCDGNGRGYLRPCWNRANQTVLYGPQYFVRANTPPQPPPSPPDPPFSPPPPLTAPSPPPSPEREDCQSWCDVGQMMDRCTTYPTMCGGCSLCPVTPPPAASPPPEPPSRPVQPTRAGVRIASSPAALLAVNVRRMLRVPCCIAALPSQRAAAEPAAAAAAATASPPPPQFVVGSVPTLVQRGRFPPAATGEDRAGAAPDAVVAARPRRRRRRRHRRPPTDQLLHRRRRHHRRRRRRRRHRRRRRRPQTTCCVAAARRVVCVAGAASPRTRPVPLAPCRAARVVTPPRSTSRALLRRLTPPRVRNSRAKNRLSQCEKSESCAGH